MTSATRGERGQPGAAMRAMACPGSNSNFHVLVAALAATGGLVLLTGGEMGPMAPLLLAGGLYLIFFALAAEAAFLVRRGVAAAARWRIRRIASRGLKT